MGNFDKRIIPILIAIIILAFAGGSWYSSKVTDKKSNSDELIILNQEEELENMPEESKITLVVVFVNGAVVNPGIYELPEGSRLYEAIDLAGGLLSGADSKHIQMARIIEDEETIYIPLIGEEAESMLIGSSYISSATSKVNINKANEAELATLNGIGPALAQRIIDYRTNNGPFKDIGGIKNVSGIGDKKYEAIKDYISIK